MQKAIKFMFKFAALAALISRLFSGVAETHESQSIVNIPKEYSYSNPSSLKHRGVLSKDEQLAAILRESLPFNSWFKRNFIEWTPENHVEILKSYKYEELFNVSIDEVDKYVQVHGWNNQIVASMNEPLPNDIDAPAPMYVLLSQPDTVPGDKYQHADPPQGSYTPFPPRKDKYRLAIDSLAGTDRPRWMYYQFDTEQDRTRFVIRRLIDTQRSFWGPSKILKVEYPQRK